MPPIASAFPLHLRRSMVWRAAGAATLALAGFATPAIGQQRSVSGTVLSAGTLTPIEAAQVDIEGGPATATDAAGRFRLTNLTGDSVTIRVRRIRYQPLTQTVRVGSDDLRLLLTETTVRLDEIIVTGTAGGEQSRSIGNTVSRIDASAEVARSGVTTVGQLLNARAPGVIVTSGSGRTGSGPSVNIRGRSTISLSQQPLLYIDGVRVVNDVGTGTRFQGGSIASRLNDIAAEDIESLEIIKGPAAATIYGTEASNGVIQIITKRGRTGGPAQWNTTVRQGSTWFQDAEGRIPTNYARDASGNIVSWNAVAAEKARDFDIWRNGRLQTYSLSLSGGPELVRYFASGNYNQDTGIEPNNAQRRFSGHVNLTALPNPKIDVAASLNVVKGHSLLGQDYGLGSFWGALYGSPLTVNTPTRGFNTAPPEVVWDLFRNTQNVDRFTGSVQLNNRPTTWFTHRATVGMDLTTEDNQGLQRFAKPDQSSFFSPTAALGLIRQDLREISYITADYSGTARFSVTPALVSSTSFGAQFYRKRINLSQVNGDQFPAPGVSTARAAAITTGSQDYLINKTVGFYGQEQIGWRDRLFLTAAVRVDNNSAFGKNAENAMYPKLSGTWVVSEEPWWKFGSVVNTLKLRSAFGLSGQQPSDSAALRTYAPTTGTLDRPAVTPQFVGNPELKPERGQELEVGFEAGLWDRVSIDFTYFSKKTKDAILARPNAPSSGFPGSQFVNIGQVSNTGLEVQARYEAIRRSNLGVEFSANIGTTKDNIDDLGGIPFVAIPGLPQRHVQDYPIAAMWAKKVIGATIGSNGIATNLVCATPADPQPCATAPVVFLGTSTPKRTGAFSTTVTLQKRLRLYALTDFKSGHRILNTDEVIRCSIFRLCLANVSPEKFSPVYVADVQNGSGLQIVNSFVQDASFARLREVSASYDVPAAWARQVRASGATLTLVGRNLHTWTKYSGLDPESRAQISNQTAFDQAVTPTLAQFLFSLSLSF
jgi:TonB-linked SusC/RagA family outer membrane protein